MNIYRFYWLDGTTSIWEGNTVTQAMNIAGYGPGALNALYFCEENEPEPTHIWNVETRNWENK